MRLVIGADHAGYRLKQFLIEETLKWENTVIDVGTHDTEPVDYPDFAELVGLALLERRADRGILICGSGVGASIAANKLPGIRAGLCHDLYSASQGVEDDDMNVLTLGARVIETQIAQKLVTAYLKARFSGEDRHVRRLHKIRYLEARYSGGATIV